MRIRPISCVYCPYGTQAQNSCMLHVQRLNSPAQRSEHRHDFHEFLLVLDGVYEVQVDGRLHRLDPNQCVLYPAGCVHTPIIADGLFVMTLQWDQAEFDAPSLLSLPRFGHDSGGGIRQGLYWLETWSADATVPECDQAALIRVILRHHARSGLNLLSDPLQRAEHQLRTNLWWNMTLDGLARNVGMSRTHLSRRFRAVYGMSPMAFRRQCRLDRAIELLRSGGMRLADVATEVGFASAAHLSNQLKAERGLRPRELMG